MLSDFPFIIALIGFLFAYRLGVSLTRKVREEALAGDWVDEPNARSSHDQPIPRVGGLAIVRTFYAGVFLTWALNGFRIENGEMLNTCHPVVLLGGGIMCLVGLSDDRKGLSPGIKFLWQFAVAILTVAVGVQFESGFMDKHSMGWVMEVLSVFWIVGIMNALNLIDGLDGLAAGVAGIAALFLITAQFIGGGMAHLFSGMVFLGALIGFLVYNHHPASIFMGDCGSLFLGYFLAVFALPLRIDAENYYLVLVPVCALGLPIFDTLSAMTRRILKGNSPFSPDKEHLHHRVARINHTSSGPYRRTITSLYIISVAFGAFGLVASVGKASWMGALVLGLMILVAVLLFKYDYLSLAATVRKWFFPKAKPLLTRSEGMLGGEELEAKSKADRANGLELRAKGLELAAEGANGRYGINGVERSTSDDCGEIETKGEALRAESKEQRAERVKPGRADSAGTSDEEEALRPIREAQGLDQTQGKEDLDVDRPPPDRKNLSNKDSKAKEEDRKAG